MKTSIIYEDNLKRDAGYNFWMDAKIEQRRDRAVPFGLRGAFDRSIAAQARELSAKNGGTIKDNMRLVGNIRLRNKNVLVITRTPSKQAA